MTAGTTGDVLPYVALGLKLKEYGHDVSIAALSTGRRNLAWRIVIEERR
jgi:UDP:flavonoid glycosyltransferase YjiC (YdhE family)